jgi:hypothetical protein
MLDLAKFFLSKQAKSNPQLLPNPCSSWISLRPWIHCILLASFRACLFKSFPFCTSDRAVHVYLLLVLLQSLEIFLGACDDDWRPLNKWQSMMAWPPHAFLTQSGPSAHPINRTHSGTSRHTHAATASGKREAEQDRSGASGARETGSRRQ